MHVLVAAQSGWGKGYLTQSLIERNASAYDTVVICDYADEYRGVVEGGHAEWYIGGPIEQAWSPSEWGSFLDSAPRTVLARHDGLPAAEWRDLVASVARSIRSRSGSVLFVVDEAHFVTPQRESYPDVLTELATTGRGEQVSYVVVTQRLSEIDKTVSTQMRARLLGGFDGDDVDRVSSIVSGYPADVHDPQADPRGVPEELQPDRDGPRSVQRHTDDRGRMVGSEWVFSDNSGSRRRLDTRGVDLDTHHYAPQEADLDLPG